MASHGTSNSAPIREAKAAGEDVARSERFEWLSRAGFVARGAIYGIIGILAIERRRRRRRDDDEPAGRTEAIAHQPFGKVLLILVAVGLGGYAAWRLVQAALGHGPEDSDSGLERVAAFASGIVYAGLCVIAIRVLIGAEGSSSSTHKTTAGVLGGRRARGSSASPASFWSPSVSTRATARSAGTSWTTRRPRR